MSFISERIRRFFKSENIKLMKKTEFKFGGITEMLTRDQMRQIKGGTTNCTDPCEEDANCQPGGQNTCAICRVVPGLQGKRCITSVG